MILAMFGLKSKRWYDKQKACTYSKVKKMPNGSGSGFTYDFEIKEYTRFTQGIEDPWDACHSMHKYDWVNSTKNITYDYRTVSAYNTKGAAGINYIPYQGLPVSYDGDESNTGGTRMLYPNFNKLEQYDGNPYYQMNGGWLSKKISDVSRKYNFQFDVDNVPVYDTSGPLYKETVRNIRKVENLGELVGIPSSQLRENTICYVEDLSKDMLIVDGEAFEIKQDKYVSYVEYNNKKNYIGTDFKCEINSTKYQVYYVKDGVEKSVTSYDNLTKDSYIKIGTGKYNVVISEFIILRKSGGGIKVGDKHFYNNIEVYGKNGEVYTYTLDDKLDGYPVYAYIKNGTSFHCADGNYTIDLYSFFRTGDTSYSNYFILNNIDFSNYIVNGDAGDGWRRIRTGEKLYKKINTIWNYYKGNNPHSGGMNYDNGEYYYEYFKHLFKYAYENDLFDERCFNDYYADIDPIYEAAGFKNISNH
jgi:hypothetical protein